MNEFDRRAFIDNLRATKPPYECPYTKCGRVYKSFSGIQAHIMNVEHSGENNGKTEGSNLQSSGDLTVSPANQKIVEYESLTDGKFYKINVLEPLEITFINTDSAAKPSRTLREIIQNIPAEKSSPSSPKTSPVCIMQPSFRILEEFSLNKASPMPQMYIKYTERPFDEIEDDVEYDMDEEDSVWLSLMNEVRQKTNLTRVSELVLERAMDFFEKNCHFAASGRHPPCQAKSPGSGQHQPQLFDEDAVCCVCLDGECDNSNAILFCDMCNLSVHQECYGVPYIPEGQWLCRRCQLSPSQAVSCVLCPNKGGAFKQTSDGRWAHVTCAIWVPEVQFANTVFLEPIEGFERIPPARWKLVCYVCKQKRNSGACIQCHKPSCYTAFHVTCAQSAGLFMKIEPVKDISPGGTQYGVRKTAFCDSHEPNNEENEGGAVNPADAKARSERREEAKGRIKKARRLLNHRRNSSPSVSIPVVPKSKLEELASQLKFSEKYEFLRRLLCYWTLKRQSRFGVPLLRRLQVCQQRKNVSKQDVALKNTGDLTCDIKYWKQVRRDLEKTRLLVELLRKREQRKRDEVIASLSVTEACLKPLRHCLVDTVEKLLDQDEMLVFAKPVSEVEVPGYSKFIQHPMDLGTMAQKAKRGDYFDLQDVQKDFNLMIYNCIKFNKKNPFFTKYAQNMRKTCSDVWTESQLGYEEACQKVSTLIVSLKQEQETACKVSGFGIGVKLSENFQEYMDERAKKRANSKKASAAVLHARQILQPHRGRGAKAAGRGQLGVRSLKKSTNLAHKSRQQDIRKFFGGAGRKGASPMVSENVDQLFVSEEDEDGPLVRLKNKARKRSKSPMRKKTAQSPDNARKKCGENSKTDGSSEFVTFAAIALPRKKSTVVSPPRSPCRSPVNKTAASPKIDRGAESFRSFRYTSATSPADCSDLEKSKDRKRPTNLSGVNSVQFKNISKPPPAKTSAPQKDHLDLAHEEDRRAKRSEGQSVKTANRMNDVIFEHMDIVWAFTPDYPHYFPGTVVDPFSTDYPPNIPKPPKELCKKQDASASGSTPPSHYLICLFDQKPTWRCLEKRLVEPMFVDNDLDRRKLVAPTKRSDEKLLKKAYKVAVDFRCTNTGEEPDEFSIIDSALSMYDDSDDSSS